MLKKKSLKKYHLMTQDRNFLFKKKLIQSQKKFQKFKVITKDLIKMIQN